jgi:transcriptional regulator GlxA family with amidase domain
MARGQRKHLRLVPSDTRAPRGDEHVQKAIELMDRELDKRWTVSELARRVGLSRPAFARRFKESTGQSPLRHLAHKRMARAAQLVRGTDWGLAQIAWRVGYDSEFAFNRAFKRTHGVAPGTFRRLWSSAATPMMRAA